MNVHILLLPLTDLVQAHGSQTSIRYQKQLTSLAEEKQRLIAENLSLEAFDPTAHILEGGNPQDIAINANQILANKAALSAIDDASAQVSMLRSDAIKPLNTILASVNNLAFRCLESGKFIRAEIAKNGQCNPIEIHTYKANYSRMKQSLSMLTQHIGKVSQIDDLLKQLDPSTLEDERLVA